MSGPGATTNIIIDDFLIDCSISENHTFDSDVTDYPVESGSNISDNIRPLPLVVEIEGVVSNTPIGLIADNRRGRTNPDQSPADDAGLRRGDVIVELNRKKIANAGEFRNIINQTKPGENLLFLIRRGGSTLFLALKSPPQQG